jgi:hypothetical protein
MQHLQSRLASVASKRSLTLALSVLLATPVFAADNPTPSASPAIRQALQRDLGIAAGDIPRYLDAERAAIQTQTEVQNALGASYAGTWLERDATGGFKRVVGTTQKTQTAKSQTLGADLRVVANSLAQLEAAMTQLNGTKTTRTVGVLRSIDKSIYAWRIDLPSNRVIVTSAPDGTDAAIDFVAASGIDAKLVRFETSKLRPQPAFDIRGGDRYNLPGGGWCSIGFSVTRGGDTGFATAGHCGTAGTAVSGNNGVGIGSFGGSTFPGSDIAWVRNTNPASWAIQPLVNNYSGGNLAVIGGLEVPVGGLTCRSGARTGYRCGYVTAKNVTVNYAAGATYGLVQSSACLGQGDSGGSFITPGGEAQGVASGGYLAASGENCSIASPISFHQPVQPILNAYGLVLQTVQTCGRMNPGRVLATGGSVTSCDGRFTFVIQSDGHLVLYQAGVGAIWWNNVFGSGHILAMQTDGNLVVYNSAGQARWHTGTYGRNGALLFVQNDGNVVIYSHQGQALWNTGTYGR